jgi:hypothetical protein
MHADAPLSDAQTVGDETVLSPPGQLDGRSLPLGLVGGHFVLEGEQRDAVPVGVLYGSPLKSSCREEHTLVRPDVYELAVQRQHHIALDGAAGTFALNEDDEFRSLEPGEPDDDVELVLAAILSAATPSLRRGGMNARGLVLDLQRCVR